jgi:hypothetical protein
MFRLLIDRFEDSLQQSAGNLQTDQSHLERYFENSYIFYETTMPKIIRVIQFYKPKFFQKSK